MVVVSVVKPDFASLVTSIKQPLDSKGMLSISYFVKKVYLEVICVKWSLMHLSKSGFFIQV